MKKKVVFTLIAAAFAAAVSGFASAEETQAVPAPEAQAPASSPDLTPEPLPPPTPETGNEQLLRAQIKARESTQISSEMAGRIDRLKIRDGERFSSGQLLVGFNCSMQEAELSKAKATFEKKQKTHEVDKKLEQLKSISKLELSVAKAEEDEARAEIKVAQAAIDRCVIKAPFSGKVVEVTARAYQSVGSGEPLMEIINDRDLEVEFIAPSKSLPQLKPGNPFKVILDETGKAYSTEIIRLGGKVDAVSQTIKVYGRITGNPTELLPGMSGAIELPN